MFPFPFVEAAYMSKMMSGGKSPVIRPLSVTENGTYNAPEGVDGYDPVYVNVPDRYDEGYNKGYSDGEQAGYDAGYSDGDRDGRAAQKEICDMEKEILLNRIEELEKKQGYTFPDGTSYDDIYEIIGGASTITDTTMNAYIETIVTDSETGSRSISVNFHASNGYTYALGGGGYGASIENAKVDSVYVNSETGDYDIAISYDFNGNHTVIHQKGKRTQLIGFGDSSHNIRVTN